MKNLFNLRDDVIEIRHIAAVLEFTSKEMISVNFENPDKYRIGLGCLFEYLDSRLESVEQGIDEQMATERGKP